MSIITVRASGDLWNGAPEYLLFVDLLAGNPVGPRQPAAGPIAVAARHDLGQWQENTFDIPGDADRILVQFVNDAFGVADGTDRNLFIDWIEVDGRRFEGEAAVNDADLGFTGIDPGAAELLTNGGLLFTGVAAVPPPPPPPPPIEGSDTLVVRVSADLWNGGPQFIVSVDGVVLGGRSARDRSPAFETTASHAAGEFEDIQITGNFGPGPHTVAIRFINDAWGGTPGTDRNLFVDAIFFNGVRYEGEAAANDADLGFSGIDPNAAEMLVNGSLVFTNVIGGTQPAPIVGTDQGETLIGTQGPDRIEALAGNDRVEGLGGADDLVAGLGDDLLLGGPGGDRLDGGAGSDTADYAGSPAGVQVSLADATASGGDAAGDQLIDLENLRGSSFNDLLIGNSFANVLEGGVGDDTLRGGGGDDVLVSGELGSGGLLFPTNRDGFDRLEGGPGNDTLSGGANTRYVIEKGNGSDTIFNYVQGGVVELVGYDIPDTAALLTRATFGLGTMTLDLGEGETLTFARGPHPGPSTITEFQSITFAFSGGTPPPPPVGAGLPSPTPVVARNFVAPGPDGTAQGTPSAEDIFATGDGQTLIGNGGDDIFHVGTFTGLTLQASDPGVSTVSTWATSFTLPGGIDNLGAHGAYGHTLVGNALPNEIYGNAGGDTLDGGDGVDRLLGFEGADLFLFRFGEGGPAGDDVIADFSRSEGDRIGVDYTLPGFAHLDAFAELQLAVAGGAVTLLPGPGSLRVVFNTAAGAEGLTINGITDLNEQDWLFLT